MAAELPLVAPGLMEMPPLAEIEIGGLLTVSANVVPAVIEELDASVAVTLTVYVPTEVVLEAAICTVNPTGVAPVTVTAAPEQLGGFTGFASAVVTVHVMLAVPV